MRGFKDLILIALTLVVVALAFPNLKDFIPSLFGRKDVPEEGIPADLEGPIVARIKGGMLEVATYSGVRNFPKATDPKVLGRAFPYCRERASWSAPFKITYRMRLQSKWNLRYSHGKIIAQVPEMEPSLPVAFDSERLSKGAQESCWFIPDQGTREQALRSITPKLKSLALNSATKNAARESARKTVREFLRTWALNQRDYPNLPADAPISVLFPGE